MVFPISFRPLIETFRGDEGMRRLFKNQSNPSQSPFYPKGEVFLCLSNSTVPQLFTSHYISRIDPHATAGIRWEWKCPLTLTLSHGGARRNIYGYLSLLPWWEKVRMRVILNCLLFTVHSISKIDRHAAQRYHMTMKCAPSPWPSPDSLRRKMKKIEMKKDTIGKGAQAWARETNVVCLISFLFLLPW